MVFMPIDDFFLSDILSSDVLETVADFIRN
jgi:hypothetical protein